MLCSDTLPLGNLAGPCYQSISYPFALKCWDLHTLMIYNVLDAFIHSFGVLVDVLCFYCGRFQFRAVHWNFHNFTTSAKMSIGWEKWFGVAPFGSDGLDWSPFLPPGSSTVHSTWGSKLALSMLLCMGSHWILAMALQRTKLHPCSFFRVTTVWPTLFQILHDDALSSISHLQAKELCLPSTLMELVYARVIWTCVRGTG